MLQRSKQAPLTLTCLNFGGEKQMGFFKQLMPYVPRWKSICGTTQVPPELIRGLCAPQLEHLLWIPPNETIDDSPSLDIVAPALKTFKGLNGSFPLRLEAGIHTQLRTLWFVASTNGTSFLPEHYRILLSENPHLEEIVVQSLEVRAPVPSTTFDAPLASLNKCTFYDLSFHTLGVLLSSITTAQDNYPLVFITHSLLFDPISAMMNQSPKPYSLLERIQGSTWLTLESEELDSIGKQIRAIAGEGVAHAKCTLLELKLVCSNRSSAMVASEFMIAGRFVQLRHLEIIGLDLFHGQLLPSAFQHLSYLETLRIRSVSQDGEQDYHHLHLTLQTLLSPAPSPLSQTRVLPRLRNLALDTAHVDLDLYTRLVDARTSD
ncbi:hypothetical protein FRC03_002172, partial [Tulasnella sp. 419]